MTSRRYLRFRFGWLRTTAAGLGCCVCAFLLARPACALDPEKRVTQYVHKSWETQDGTLPAMFSIAQTSDGFLWFLSPVGDIYRHDGVQFLPWIVPSQDDSTKKTRKLFGDHAGGLWLIGERGISYVKGRVVTSHLDLRGFLPFAGISENADGSLWVVRGRNAVSDAPLCHVNERAFKCFGKSDGIPIAPADALLSDGNGGFWIGGQTALVHWRDGVSQIYPIPALKSNAGNNGISSLARGPDGTLWVGILSEGPGLGLGQLKDGAFRPFATPTFDGSKVPVYNMILDHDGSLWVGTEGKGIYRIHGNVVDHYGRTDGLSSDTVFALFEDREGIVWAATTNGIDKFRDPRITTFSADEGLGKDAAIGILASQDGSIWVANSGSLDHIVSGTISSIRTGKGLPGRQVTSLLEDRAGNLWVGVDDGLYLLKDGRFRRLPEPDHKPLGLVVGMTEDIDGNIWAACAGNPRKLVRIRDFQVREEFPSSQVPPGHTLAPDPHGGIWIGTLRGDLVLLRNGAVETFPLNLKDNPVSHQIIAQADGSVLAASEDGLVGLRNGKPQRMTKENGLPCDSVISFIADKEKRWWLYTGCGIVELPDSELQRWWANAKAVVQTHVYDTLDGAQPSTPSFNSAAYSSDGRIWFATGLVVQMVDPSKLSQKASPAKTYIESVIVDRKEFTATDNLRLPPNPRDMRIDYTSPTFLIARRVEFRYRLDPNDQDWHEAGTRRQAFYTDLPPGKYTFRVMAANSDGVWNESAAQLNFSIAPAYYQTNWFRALCAVLFLALLWAAYQMRVRQLAHQFNLSLEARVAERTRIARDLHDTLLQSFQGLLPRFQAAIYRLPESPVDARKTLEAAVDKASQAITDGRDAVQGLRMSTVEKNDLGVAIRTIGEEFASAETNHSAPKFEVVVEGTPRNLHPILRDEVYRLAAEALRNAFLHAQARQIEVELRYGEKDFTIRVRDNGRGINHEVLSGGGREGHYGLHGMRERANLVGGELEIWSEVDSGTEVELSIPASRAYAKFPRRFWLFQKVSKKDTDVKEKVES